MTSLTPRWLAAVAALSLPAAGLVAQRPAPATQRQVDSLAAELRRLQARLDSVLVVLARLQAAGPRPDTTLAAVRAESVSVQDDLAALRAAAAAAAGPRDTAGTPPPTRVVGRDQSQLNPELTVTGDVRATGTTSGIQRENFDPREFEVGFQSALDPYSRTKVFVSLENGEVAVEEGYAYWTGLPGRLRLDVGKFRQQFGELNRWHLHAVPETEYPLALRTYLGEDGLSGTGLSLYRAFGGLGTHEIVAQITRSASDGELFGGGGRPSYLVHLLNFWQLGRATYMQIGGTGLLGGNPDSSLRTAVGGIEFRFTWRPPQRALYRDWTVRGELLALRKRVSGTGATRIGGYVSSTYKLNQRFIAGLRYDYVEEPSAGVIVRHLVPSLTLWQSEWVMLRAQYTWEKVATATSTHQVALQAVWAMGPHKHETY
ncbi:MAG TPA: hypothetical protein VLB49_13905 [Gemmatimonadales bacterium]|nr:hypothetical protein [Gemmatimonadales bacterium]